MIKFDLSKMGADIKALRDAGADLRKELAGQETMEALAAQAVTLVKARTIAGRDADGSPFDPYTPAYAKFRADGRRSRKTGRITGGGRSTVPNLVFSGKMLNNIHGQILGFGRAVLLFLNDDQANKAAGNSHKRDFFDIRLPSELAAMRAELQRQVARVINRLKLGGTI